MVMVLAGSFSALSQGIQMAGTARSEQFAEQLLTSEMEFLKTLPWENIYDDSMPDEILVDADNSSLHYIIEGSYTATETRNLFTGVNFNKDSNSSRSIRARDWFNGEFPLRDATLDVTLTDPYNSGTYDDIQRVVTYTLSWKEVDGRVMTKEAEFLFCKSGVHDSFVPIL